MNSSKPLPFLIALLWLLSALLATTAHANTATQESTVRTSFTAAELDQMLSPIALYPDTVLSHILIASTYPIEVVQADRWARANPSLEGEAAVTAVENEDWDPSVKALAAFPQILQRMSEDLAWTQRLGDAFLDDEAAVMDRIQTLRRKAYDAGTLDKVEHLRVQREKEVIVIEPAVERVVYVPVYDTRVVYGPWWWVDYPPIYWHYPAHYTFVSGFYWGPRIYVGPSFYFSSFHWHRRHVVYVDYRRYHHRPHFHTGRSIVSYSGARHWRHNPTHRRGVAYHNERLQRSYASNRQNYSRIHQQRQADAQWRRSGQADSPSAGRRLPADRRPAREAAPQQHNLSQGGTLQQHRQSESERVQQRLSNREHSANNQQQIRTTRREERYNERQIGPNRNTDRLPQHRGNSTLPSQSDPRPGRQTGEVQQGARTVPDTRGDNTPGGGLQRGEQRQIENRQRQPGPSRAERSERAAETGARHPSAAERAVRQQHIGRPPMQERARPARNER